MFPTPAASWRPERLAETARSRGVEVALHSCCSSVLLAGNYHLAFTLPDCRVVEYPTWGNPRRDILWAEPPRIEGGCMYPPQAPGLGLGLRDEVRDRYAYRDEHGLVMEREGAAEPEQMAVER